MANYYGTARTNYFKVKDLEAFKTAISALSSELELVEAESGVAVLSNGESGWPYLQGPDDDELSIREVITPHLQPGSIVVLMESGAENLRYVNGVAVEFDHTGKSVSVNLEEIYSKAARAFGALTSDITRAEY